MYNFYACLFEIFHAGSIVWVRVTLTAILAFQWKMLLKPDIEVVCLFEDVSQNWHPYLNYNHDKKKQDQKKGR